MKKALATLLVTLPLLVEAQVWPPVDAPPAPLQPPEAGPESTLPPPPEAAPPLPPGQVLAPPEPTRVDSSVVGIRPSASVCRR